MYYDLRNQYVRTTQGYIAKLTGCKYDSFRDDIDLLIFDKPIWKVNYKPSRCILRKDLNNRLYKHSSMLIDLVQIDDYVNGYRVTNVYHEGIRHYIKLENRNKHKIFENRIYNEDIENIVTKEMFEMGMYEA